VHHVYARGNRQQRIYLDDRDRSEYLRLLGEAVFDHEWRCLAFCLLDNHLHLVIETPQPNLGDGMQWLHGTYARIFNDRHRRSGHLFQGRFGAKPIRTDPQLWAVVRYVALNPVAAGVCSTPQQWPWGSCGRQPPWLDQARLLQYLGAAGGNPWRRYAQLIATNPQPGV
jgi:REP element-mobilizing transposase RayT